MSSTVQSPSRPRTAVAYRVGLALAALLSLGDIVGGATQLGAGAMLPVEVAVFAIVMGVLSLVLVPLAWRGASWAVWALVATRALSAAGALPAFFVGGVPIEGIVSASATIVVTIVCIVLILAKRPTR